MITHTHTHTYIYETVKKLIELTNSIKLQSTKSIQKSVAFLYTNNELSEREIKETVLLKLHQKEQIT